MSAQSLAELEKKIARLAPAKLEADISRLSKGDRAALVKLVEAARHLDSLFLTQMWSGNHSLYQKLKVDTSPLGRGRLRYFEINKGPWSSLDHHEAFVPGVPPRKLGGAN